MSLGYSGIRDSRPDTHISYQDQLEIERMPGLLQS
jgi:hypothetical protein